jgi:hypothetical protein
MPNTMSPLAQTLKLNGYATSQFGKCHEVPVWQTSPVGPFDHWPSGGGGFEYFYGFIGGETNQWFPALYDCTTVTKHRTPWETGMVKLVAFDDDVWELYDTTTDWSQAKDLAKENPQKLHELQRLWLIEAVKYNVLPLDDRFAERANPDIAGRPQLIKGTRQLLFSGMGRLSESSIVNYKNRSHAVTAELSVPPSGAEGVIISVGGILGGWSLYAKNGKLKYHYNFYGVDRYSVEGTSAILPGTHQVRMEFAYDGGVLRRAARSHCTSTERRTGKAVWTTPSLWSSLPTRPAMSATTSAHP